VGDGPDFEIDVDPDEPADEELLSARRHASPRVGVATALLLGAVVVAVVAVRLVSAHHGTPTAAPPSSPTAAPHSSPARVPPTPTLHPSRGPHGRARRLDELPVPTPHPLASCPLDGSPRITCSVSHTVSGPVTAAIRERFPRAHHFRQVDVALRAGPRAAPRLYLREVRARLDHVQLVITVSRQALDVPGGLSDRPNLLAYSYFTRAGLHVASVGTALGYRWRLLPAARMFSLTSDPRLRATTLS
jgi:hypothetical protein